MKQLLTLSLTLTLANFAIPPAFTQSLPKPPGAPSPSGDPVPGGTNVKPPDAPPPRGNPTPGGTFSDVTCEKTAKPLHALIPLKNLEPLLIGQGLTASEHPTFWVYNPYSSTEPITAKFSLHDRRGRALYRTTLNLPKTAGIIGLQIPAEAQYALKEEQFYRWYFSIQCTASSGTLHDLVVDGWVKRVALTPEIAAQINTAKPEIWYDSLTRLANLRLASPQDSTLKKDWSDLLTSAGLEALVEEPLLGPIIELN